MGEDEGQLFKYLKIKQTINIFTSYKFREHPNPEIWRQRVREKLN